jgi:hypothetical protein
MSTDDFERDLRSQLTARAAELDLTGRPVPDLQAVLVSPSVYTRSNRRMSLWLGVAVAGAAILALVLLSGSFLLGQRPGSYPLASVTPSASPTLATASVSLANSSPSLATASPSQSPTPSAWSPQITASGPDGESLRQAASPGS